MSKPDWKETFKKLPEIVQDRLSMMETESKYKNKLQDLTKEYINIIETHHIIKKIEDADNQQKQTLKELERRHFNFIEGIARGKDRDKEVCQRCLKFTDCDLRKQNEEYKSNPIVQCEQYQPVTTLSTKSLNDVHTIFNKWFPIFDTTRIDTRLAWYLANEFGLPNPLWIVEIARSGLTKSSVTEAFKKVPKVKELRQMTTHMFASVKSESGKPVHDFGAELHNRNRGVIIPESAYVKAMDANESKEIYASMKDLHDGIISRKGGSGVFKEYDNCNTSMWINSTPDFRHHLLIQQIVGTCYLIDAIPLDMDEDIKGVDDALKNRKLGAVRQKELNAVIRCFLAHRRLRKDIELTEEDTKWLNREAQRLKITRAVGSFDQYGELKGNVEPEFPARVAEACSKIYTALLSLDDNYSKERARKIIERIVDGSGDSIMVSVLSFFDTKWTLIQSGKEDWDKTYSVVDVRKFTGLGNQAIKKRLEMLTNLNYLCLEHKEKGEGRKGNVYSLNENVSTKMWQMLFRYKILEKNDLVL